MFKLINEDLMSYEPVEVFDKKTQKSFTKLKVVTSNKIQQYEGSRNFQNRSQPYQSNHTYIERSTSSNRNGIENTSEKLLPVNREILRISAPLKTMGNFVGYDSRELMFDLPMSINVDCANQYKPLVEIRCHERGEDRANIYVVAFPFNGMIRPIVQNPQYRIYKGLIASSAKPFFYQSRRYRKVLYLIIEPNKNLFNKDHKYHTDSIDIALESFSIYTDRDTSEKKTNYEKMVLSIISAEGDSNISWEYETINKPVYMNTETSEPLWETYTFEKRETQFNGTSNSRKFEHTKSNKNNNPPQRVEGNTIITTNKHGIRKEVTINNRRSNHRDNAYSNDLDRMIYEADMYNEYDNHRSKKNGGKKNKRFNRQFD